jgi:hypothetical protein
MAEAHYGPCICADNAAPTVGCSPKLRHTSPPLGAAIVFEYFLQSHALLAPSSHYRTDNGPIISLTAKTKFPDLVHTALLERFFITPHRIPGKISQDTFH